jgi:hypothetical protein
VLSNRVSRSPRERGGDGSSRGASADASDDYPIPNRILKTTCTVDQYMAAVRDVEPIYYQRHMIDYNRPPTLSRRPRPHLLVLLAGLRGTAAVFEDTATNVYYEQMATHQ